jgi:hypothetical protein
MTTKTAALKTALPKTPVPKAPRAKSTASRPQEGKIVETAQEARGGEPGPSVLALLTVSTIAAIFVLSIVWFMFFRTTT